MQSKAPDWTNLYARTLAWLITMAKEPGWKAHAWHRAKELDTDPMMKGIAKDLADAMNSNDRK